MDDDDVKDGKLELHLGHVPFCLLMYVSKRLLVPTLPGALSFWAFSCILVAVFF